MCKHPKVIRAQWLGIETTLDLHSRERFATKENVVQALIRLVALLLLHVRIFVVPGNELAHVLMQVWMHLLRGIGQVEGF